MSGITASKILAGVSQLSCRHATFSLAVRPALHLGLITLQELSAYCDKTVFIHHLRV